MGLMLICVTISLPFWQWVGRKMDKGPAYALGMLVGGAGGGADLLPAASAPPLIYLFVSVLAGFGFSAQWIFPWAMVADVADYDRVETGQQRSGMYYGVWGLATKISEALALAAVGWILTGFGYVPNVEQTSPGPAWHPPVLWARSRRPASSLPCRYCSNIRSPARAMLQCGPDWKPWT